MEKVLAENVKRLCREQKKQLKDLASEMGVDPASLNRAMYGNARLYTIEKMANALGVSIKSLFDPIDDDTVEGYIKAILCNPADLIFAPTLACWRVRS